MQNDIFLSMLLATGLLTCAGCATKPQPQVNYTFTVKTDIPDAPTQISLMRKLDGPVLVTKKAVNGRASFVMHGPATAFSPDREHYMRDAYFIKVDAEGYEALQRYTGITIPLDDMIYPHHVVDVYLLPSDKMRAAQNALEEAKRYGVKFTEAEARHKAWEWMKLTDAQRDATVKKLRVEHIDAVIAQHPEWPGRIVEAIRQQQIATGMTPEAVTLSWGKPTRIIRSGGLGGELVTWFYETGPYSEDSLFFRDGQLMRWTLER